MIITMILTPEEKFNKSVWWMLQEIRREQLLTSSGRKVEFALRLTNIKSRKIFDGFPLADDQRKLLYKFEEWEILNLEPASELLVGIFDLPTKYELIIFQEKFDEIYKLYETKNNKLLKYDDFTLKKYKQKRIKSESIGDSDLSLYIKKKILVEDWRDDLPHPICELSFSNNTLEQICYSLWDLFIADIIFFGVNTFPENILIDADPRFSEDFVFNWNLIRNLDNNLLEVENDFGFEIELLDENKLKKSIEKEINELISSKPAEEKSEKIKELIPDSKYYDSPSYLLGAPKNYYSYLKQRKILLSYINVLHIQLENNLINIRFNEIDDIRINVLRTIIALEKEGFLTIIELNNSKKEWCDEDDIYAKIRIDKADIPILRQFKTPKKEVKNTFQKEPRIAKIEITKIPALQISNQQDDNVPARNGKPIIFPVKSVRLDDKNFLLEINGGEKNISFKSKKGKEDLEKETKLFKILYQLWEFRWEFKNNKVTSQGDWATLENLKNASKSESESATSKSIQRLNEKFANNGLAIKIETLNEKYRLIINKL